MIVYSSNCCGNFNNRGLNLAEVMSTHKRKSMRLCDPDEGYSEAKKKIKLETRRNFLVRDAILALVRKRGSEKSV